MTVTKNLVAAWRTDKTAVQRHRASRAELLETMREGVRSGEWQIVDVAELVGLSRETVRKIVETPDLTYVSIPRDRQGGEDEVDE